MPQINPSRATTAMTEGTGEQTEANALTAVINEFNGNIDGTNIKQSVAIALGALGITIGTDTNLYRSAANILKTDDALRSADNVQAQAAAATQVEVGSVGGAAGVALGLSADTTLTRTAAGVMRTNGAYSSGGKANIAAAESTTATSYAIGNLTTPDRVQNVVMPTDGLIAVWYQAIWQNTVASNARAAIFLGANQVKAGVGTGAPVAVDTSGPTDVNDDGGLFTNPGAGTGALLSTAGGAGAATEVTTGQAVGSGLGGPVYIFAAAGTYDVSIQFKNSAAGTLTVKNRHLWVMPMAFA
jgi:hypothetical protein